MSVLLVLLGLNACDGKADAVWLEAVFTGACVTELDELPALLDEPVVPATVVPVPPFEV